MSTLTNPEPQEDPAESESNGSRRAARERERRARTVGALVAVLYVAAGLAGGAVWVLTTYGLVTQGETLLALLAFFVPPADLVLAFVVNTTLGVVGLASAAVLLGVRALAGGGR